MARRSVLEQENPFALRTPEGLVPARAAAAPAVPGSPTALQLRLLHLAARQAGLDETDYRLVLKNCAGVASSKNLDQAGFEDVLALFEERGYRDAGKPEDYWRSKVATRGSLCGARMEFKINELAGKQTYALSGLRRRFSNERTERVDRLSSGEAYRLVEALKEIIEREAATPAAQQAGSDHA